MSTSSVAVLFKTVFNSPTGEVDTRRFSLPAAPNNEYYRALMTHLQNAYGETYELSPNHVYSLSYVDPDGDICSIGSDIELAEAIRCANGHALRLEVRLVEASRSSSRASAHLGFSAASSHSSTVNTTRHIPHISVELSQPQSEVSEADVTNADDMDYVRVDEAKLSSALAQALSLADDSKEAPFQPQSNSTASPPITNTVSHNDVHVEASAIENTKTSTLPVAESMSPSFDSPFASSELPQLFPRFSTSMTSSAVMSMPPAVTAAPLSSVVSFGTGLYPELPQPNQTATLSLSEGHYTVSELGNPLQSSRTQQLASSTTASAEEAIVHSHTQCDMCDVFPIRGIRYKCTECHDYDLCSNCEAKGVHPKSHPLIKIQANVFGRKFRRFGGHHRPGSTPCDNTEGEPCSWRRGRYRGGFWSRMQQAAENVRLFPSAFPGSSVSSVTTDFVGSSPAATDGNTTATQTSAGSASHAVATSIATASNYSEEKPKAEFIRDITLENGFCVRPGQQLIKMWSVKNNGSTSWPVGTKLVFVGGDVIEVGNREGYHNFVTVPGAAPGATVLLKIDIRVPEVEGRIRATFRLCTPSGEFFGPRIWLDLISKRGDSPIDTIPPTAQSFPVGTLAPPVARAAAFSQTPNAAAAISPQAASLAPVTLSDKKTSDQNTNAGSISAAVDNHSNYRYAHELDLLTQMGFVVSPAHELMIKNFLNQYSGDLQRVLNSLVAMQGRK